MGYRHEHKDHGMDVVLPIDNGTISHISIPCFRRPPLPPGRHRDEHNHQGWPSPDSPDDTCQGPWDGDEPDVDLLEEGYDSVEVSLLDQPEGFSVAGQIDGNKVRLTITAVCEAAETECVNVPFAVYLLGSEEVEGEDEPVVTMRDLAAKGVIHIVEGPVGDSVPWVAPTTESRIEESVTEHVNELVGQIDERIDGQLEQLGDRINDATGNGSITVNDDGTVSSDSDVWKYLGYDNLYDATPYVNGWRLEPVTENEQTVYYDMSEYFYVNAGRLFVNRFRKRVYGEITIKLKQPLPQSLISDRKFIWIACISPEYAPSCFITEPYLLRHALEMPLIFTGTHEAKLHIGSDYARGPQDNEYHFYLGAYFSQWPEETWEVFSFKVDYPIGGTIGEWDGDESNPPVIVPPINEGD